MHICVHSVSVVVAAQLFIAPQRRCSTQFCPCPTCPVADRSSRRWQRSSSRRQWSQIAVILSVEACVIYSSSWPSLLASWLRLDQSVSGLVGEWTFRVVDLACRRDVREALCWLLPAARVLYRIFIYICDVLIFLSRKSLYTAISTGGLMALVHTVLISCTVCPASS